MFQFFLATELGMTVSELQDRMTFEELVGWSAYYEIKYRREEEARRKAMRGRR